MLIEDYTLAITHFEELLQKITSNMTSGIVFEKLAPPELWKRCEDDVAALQSATEQINDLMLILKPEKTPTIKKQTAALLQPLANFKEILFRKSDDLMANSKIALEELRRAIVEGANLLDLAKEIEKKPSEGISAILKLKEVFDAKEYLSAVSVPEAAYTRLMDLKKNLESLKLSVSNLERILGELLGSIDRVVEEIYRFRPSPSEEVKQEQKKPEASPGEKAGSEPTLVSGSKK